LRGLRPTDEERVRLVIGGGARPGQTRRIPTRVIPPTGDRLYTATVVGQERGLRLLAELPGVAARRADARRALVVIRIWTAYAGLRPATAPDPQWVPCWDRSDGPDPQRAPRPQTCLYCATPYSADLAHPGQWVHPPTGSCAQWPGLAEAPGVTVLASGWNPLGPGRRAAPLGYSELLGILRPRARLRLPTPGPAQLLTWTGATWRATPGGALRTLPPDPTHPPALADGADAPQPIQPIPARRRPPRYRQRPGRFRPTPR
jgi:hypothetical protein